MSAHLRPVPQPKCERCGAAAKKQVFNTYNAHGPFFCRAHAKEGLRNFQIRAGELSVTDARRSQ